MKKINILNLIIDILNEGSGATELHCQKIIFFLYGLFKKKFGVELLQNPDFRAWKYGVVEINCHNFFKNIEKNKALDFFNIEMELKEKYAFIIKVISILAEISPWKLVEIAHLSYAWIANYDIGDSKIPLIDVDLSFLNLDLDSI